MLPVHSLQVILLLKVCLGHIVHICNWIRIRRMECAVRISHWFPLYFVVSFALPFSSAAKADGIVTLEMSDKYLQSSRKGFQCVMWHQTNYIPLFSFPWTSFTTKVILFTDGTIMHWKAFFKKFWNCLSRKDCFGGKELSEGKIWLETITVDLTYT